MGDICLDRWCYVRSGRCRTVARDRNSARRRRRHGGDARRRRDHRQQPGRAGRRATWRVLGAVGDDGFGYELRCALAARGISDAISWLPSPAMQTFTYTKLINAATGEEDLPRVDFINTTPLDRAAERADPRPSLQTRDRRLRRHPHLRSGRDQPGGVVTPALRDVLARPRARLSRQGLHGRFAHAHRTVSQRDPQAESAGGGDGVPQSCSARSITRPCSSTREAPLLIVTQGARAWRSSARKARLGSRAEQSSKPVDICGAGDSFSAGAAWRWR